MVNNETGEFDCEGNLYSISSEIKINMKDPELAPKDQGGDNKFIVKSWGITTKEVNASAEV